MEQAVEGGDELAHALIDIARLNDDLNAARTTHDSLRTELRQLATALRNERQRGAALIALNAELAAERDQLRVEVGELRHLVSTRTSTLPPPMPQMPRAQRRQLEREQRRRH